MAKSIDEIVQKFSTEGLEKIDQATNSLKNLEKASDSTNKTVRAFNTRTLTANIQDIAVQAEMGTNWLRILGQQGSEVLAAFGPKGAAAGAALAVGIAVARPVLEALGYDLRSTKERVDDLTKSTSNLKDAQRLNQSSVAFLATEYGNLSSEAKRFFDINQELTKLKSLYDLKQSLEGIKGDFKSLGMESKDLGGFGKVPIFGELAALGTGVAGWVTRLGTGITAETAKQVSKMLETIDASKPEQTAKTLNDIVEYLRAAGADDSLIKNFTASLEPILKINKALLEQERNIKAASERASEFNAVLFREEASAGKQINAAKRNFDQITAIRKEGDLKYFEFKKQLDAKSVEDGVNREKELRAFKTKNDQETADKEKDFLKSQEETYKSALLQNESKKEQLILQGKILGLSEEGRLSAFNNYQLQQDILTNAREYNQTLENIKEQRRKNIIDEVQANQLRKDAKAIQESADQNAYSAAERRQKSFLENQNQIIAADGRRLELFKQTSILSDREAKNADAIFNINEDRRKQMEGLAKIEDPILRVAKEKEINDTYAQRVEILKKQQAEEKSLQGDFGAGIAKGLNNYIDESQNRFKQAQTVIQSMTKTLEDSLVKLFQTGKLGWKDMLNSMIEALMRSQIQQLLGGIINAGKSNSGGGLFGGSIIPGFLASGGPAGANTPYIVGESGPELFVPNTAGTVVPNEKLGASTSVVYNINAVDAMSFKQMIAADPTFLFAVTEQGRRRVPGAM